MNRLTKRRLERLGSVVLYPAPSVWPTLLVSPALTTLWKHIFGAMALCGFGLIEIGHGDGDVALTAIVLSIIVADIWLWAATGEIMEPLVFWTHAGRSAAAARRFEHVHQFYEALPAARRQWERQRFRSVVSALHIRPQTPYLRLAYRSRRATRRTTTTGGEPSDGGDGSGDSYHSDTTPAVEKVRATNPVSRWISTGTGFFVSCKGISWWRRTDR